MTSNAAFLAGLALVSTMQSNVFNGNDNYHRPAQQKSSPPNAKKKRSIKKAALKMKKRNKKR